MRRDGHATSPIHRRVSTPFPVRKQWSDVLGLPRGLVYMVAIAAHGLSKEYGRITALDRVDLTVEEGEIFGFLGPNGAGKSTFINLLLDFVRPTAGAVEMFGQDCQSAGVTARERVGVLPEGYSVFDRLTGREHVEYARSVKEAEADPVEILDRVGIREAADRPATDYSKGMKQRLVLGMALVGEPDLLVLDEPTTGLDPNGAADIRTILREERERGAAVFFSSHILEQVEAVCDRVGILQDGELVAVDTIDGLRDSLGGGTKLVITPDDLESGTSDALRSVSGVETVTVRDGPTLEVTCTNDAKMDVLVELQETGVDVINFRTEEASLEDMFVEYTGGD
jgi:ABC-2 type transport system ATP-binding protein